MLKPQTLDFLSQVSLNNNRLWFKNHRDEYDTARENFKRELDIFTEIAVKIDSRLTDSLGERHMFRINRDVRFSKNKQPYKSHMSGYIAPGGKANIEFRACYYMRVKPFDSFVGGGSYGPSKQYLDKIRERIATHGHELEAIISDKKFIKYFGELNQTNKLKTGPKGYAKDHKYIELLKYKSFSARSYLADEILESRDAHTEYKKRIKAIAPLVQWLNNIHI